MFQVFGLQGRVFSGTLDEWRRLPAASPVARARKVPGGSDREEAPGGESGGTAHSAAGRQAVAEYDAVANPKHRHVLTIVADVMRSPAHTLSTGIKVGDALQALARLGIGQAPVVDDAGFLLGMAGRVALLAPVLVAGSAMPAADWQALIDRPVIDLMWTPVPSASAETDLRHAASVLLESGLPGLPVTDEAGRVTGFVSRTDLLRALASDPPLDLWG